MSRRPKLSLLTEEEVLQIHEESLRLLEEVGMTIQSQAALSLLEQAGAPVDYEKQHANFPISIIEDQLKHAPTSITLYSRTGEPALNLQKDNVYFNPGSAATHLLDRKTGERRHPRVSDVVEFARVTDLLPNINAQSTALIPDDVPNILADRYRLYLILQYSTKPIITGTFALDAFEDMQLMLEAIAGSPAKLREKPLAIFDACPSAPLNWSELTVHDLLLGAKAGIPIELISMPQFGATGPITLAGSLVLHNAESLSGIVLTQLAAKGAPVIYGGSPTAVDMQYGTARLGAIEAIMLTCAYAQMAKHYGLPTHGYLGLSDAKLGADSQTGYEASMGLLLGAMAGINNIAGAGMLSFESTQSFEKLVIDDILAGIAKRFIQGITVDEDTLALNELREVGTKGGDFLRLRHTLTWFRKEHYLPGDLVDRQPYESWLEQGGFTSLDRARNRVEKILETQEVVPLTKDQKQDLDSVVKSFMHRYHCTALPHGPN
ncbi:MAG: trimethylamine methyltransferase family protein [Candidatus Thorarchaeota archaeon]